MFYHPKSIVQIPPTLHSEFQEALQFFQQGSDYFDSEFGSVRETICEERIRFFLEECDSFQGFNILVDADTGFSGLASQLSQSILDDLPKSPIHIYALSHIDKYDTQSPEYALAKLNQTIFLSRIHESHITYIPMNVPQSILNPFLNMNDTLLYHTSAYICSNIDNITLPYRLASGRVDMRDVSSILGSFRGYNISSYSSCRPDSITNLNSVRHGQKVPYLNNLSLNTPYDTIETEIGALTSIRYQSPPSFNEILEKYKTPMGHDRLIISQNMFNISETFPPIFNINGHPLTTQVPSFSRLSFRKSVGVEILGNSNEIIKHEKKWKNKRLGMDMDEVCERVKTMFDLYDDL